MEKSVWKEGWPSGTGWVILFFLLNSASIYQWPDNLGVEDWVPSVPVVQIGVQGQETPKGIWAWTFYSSDDMGLLSTGVPSSRSHRITIIFTLALKTLLFAHSHLLLVFRNIKPSFALSPCMKLVFSLRKVAWTLSLRIPQMAQLNSHNYFLNSHVLNKWSQQFFKWQFIDSEKNELPIFKAIPLPLHSIWHKLTWELSFSVLFYFIYLFITRLYYIAQAGVKLANSPASTFRVLGL